MDKKYKNQTFWDEFHSRLQDDTDDLKEIMDNYKEMIENILLDFKFNRDAKRTIKLVEEFEKHLNSFFDKHKDTHFKEDIIEDLTSICRKINEDETIQIIRDHANEPEPVVEKKPVKVHAGIVDDTHENQNENEKQDVKIEDEPLIQEKNIELNSESKKIVNQEEKEDINLKEQVQPEIIEIAKEKSKPDSTQLINDLVKNIKEYYSEHLIEDAYMYYCELKKLKEAMGSDDLGLPAMNQAFIDNDFIFKCVVDESTEIEKMLHNLEDEEGWILEKVKKGLIVKYKKNPGDTYALRIETTFEVPIFNIIVLIYEADGHTEWIPFCSKAFEAKPIHRASKAIYQKYSFPPPLSDREAFIFGYGVDRMKKNGSLLIISKSYDKNPEMQKRYDIPVAEKSKCVRMIIEQMAAEITPITRNKCHFKCVLKVDPQIKYIPLSFINWLFKKSASLILERISKKAKNLKGSKWEEKMKGNKQFYDWLEERVEKNFKEFGIE